MSTEKRKLIRISLVSAKRLKILAAKKEITAICLINQIINEYWNKEIEKDEVKKE